MWLARCIQQKHTHSTRQQQQTWWHIKKTYGVIKSCYCGLEYSGPYVMLLPGEKY